VHALLQQEPVGRRRGRGDVREERDGYDSGQWYGCKDQPESKICVSCYKKFRYVKKKAASAKEK